MASALAPTRKAGHMYFIKTQESTEDTTVDGVVIHGSPEAYRAICDTSTAREIVEAQDVYELQDGAMVLVSSPASSSTTGARRARRKNTVDFSTLSDEEICGIKTVTLPISEEVEA